MASSLLLEYPTTVTLAVIAGGTPAFAMTLTFSVPQPSM